MPRETGWKLSIPAEISRWRLGWRSAGAALHAGPHFAVGVCREGALSGQRGQPGHPELKALLPPSMLPRHRARRPLRHRMRRWAACGSRRLRGLRVSALTALHDRPGHLWGRSQARAPVSGHAGSSLRSRAGCAGMRGQPPAVLLVNVSNKARCTPGLCAGACCPGSKLDKGGVEAKLPGKCTGSRLPAL